jgi:hypothetical protein
VVTTRRRNNTVDAALSCRTLPADFYLLCSDSFEVGVRYGGSFGRPPAFVARPPSIFRWRKSTPDAHLFAPLIIPIDKLIVMYTSRCGGGGWINGLIC